MYEEEDIQVGVIERLENLVKTLKKEQTSSNDKGDEVIEL